VIVTADVLHLERQLARFARCARQLALADRIVLTMADLAPRASVQACRALLGGRFPRARVYTRAQAEAHPGRLLGAGLYDAERGHLQPRAWLGAGALAGAPAHAGTVQSFVVRFDARPPWAVLQQWLGALLALRGEQVLRVKGIARIADHAAPVAVHAVHHRLHAPVDLAHARGLPCASTFVFVTDGLAPEEVQASLAGWGFQGQV
jgi:G3E family GTPase